MLRVTLVYLGLMSLLFLGSCANHVQGDGKITEISHSLEYFDRVALQGVFEVELIQGENGIEVITDGNLHDYISITVTDSKLTVSSGENILSAEKLLLRISCEDLRAVEISGAVELFSKETLQSDEFYMGVSGAVDADIDLAVKKFSLDINGGGDVHLSGTADVVEIAISGAGEVAAPRLSIDQAAVGISGAGQVELGEVKALNVKISGAGQVTYSGDPTVTKSISGAGSVKKA